MNSRKLIIIFQKYGEKGLLLVFISDFFKLRFCKIMSIYFFSNSPQAPPKIQNLAIFVPAHNIWYTFTLLRVKLRVKINFKGLKYTIKHAGKHHN